MQNVLGRLAEERRIRKEKALSREHMLIDEDKYSSSINPVVLNVVSEINENITPSLVDHLEQIDDAYTSFADSADSRNIAGMIRSLDNFNISLRKVVELVNEFKLIVFDAYKQTKSASDAQIIINSTFSPDEIKMSLIDKIKLLEGTAEELMGKIRYDLPDSRIPVDLLQTIQKFGEENLEGFIPRDVVVEMDVSGDEALAKRLAGVSSQLYRPHSRPITEPGYNTYRRPDVEPRRSTLLNIEEAQKIVDANPTVDVLTLSAILKARGFDERTIDIVLPSDEYVPKERRSSLGDAAHERDVTIPSVDLNGFTVKELVRIAKKYGLSEYRRKRKPVLIRYLQSNLTSNILRDEIRIKLHDYKVKDIPVITSE